ncbi:dihydrodipicolinate synthase family protein [Cohnella herbarum]|uniref:Dihydrodipicolinate synthase family protein n=1 Tax=Cohnella herbarum TaxID=2728023 RepID=A0A7Z2ZM04_9BACL|nr:dihydrodipicolinate synthase family protein [Cohnella herbarum]QJD84548.1 dihydrodipicolinate synthase family protein [Cohnella herbarum]
MLERMKDGVWPTMVTLYNDNGRIDYTAMEKAVRWYVLNGADGLFAVCQSSEMFYLNLEERVELAAFVKKATKGKIPVIASGHISESLAEQAEELRAMSETGIDALVLITNRLALEGESDDIVKRNVEKLLPELPDKLPIGLYECPFPYKRVVSPELLRWFADTGRFCFLKDTCCDIGLIRGKLDAVRGTDLKIFNANTATLLESLRLGAAGYSGVMGNFHPSLYSKLVRDYRNHPVEAERLSDLLTMASWIEKQLYPTNAKYHLMLEGIAGNYGSRSQPSSSFTETNKSEVAMLRRLSEAWEKQLPS